MQFYTNYHHFKLLVMRGSSVALLIALFSVHLALALPAESQNLLNTRVSIQLKGRTIEQGLQQLHQKTGIDFVYSSLTDLNQKVNLSVKNKPAQEVIKDLLSGTSLTYDLVGSKIVIHKRSGERKTMTASSVTRAALITISGVVKDKLGNPLPGVSIQIVGTTKGTITDAAGKYNIQANPADSLQFSYIGYETQTLPVRNRVDLNVEMEAAEGSLNQVVVVGYGKQKKISMVGSQSSVEVAQLKLPTAKLNTVLAGRLAGVVSVQRSGELGSHGADIWIRGISTFSSSLSKPLILVDGVPRDFADIDPEDIASFSILKDAAATAVYGVRGANGVILITTKSGKVGKPVVKFRYNEGITSFTKLPDFADGVTYMNASNEASVTRGGDPKYSQSDIEKTRNKVDPDLYPDVDWYDALFRKLGHQRNGNLNISGGSERAVYYVGLSYYDETGMYKQDSLQKYDSQNSYKRYNLTSNLKVEVTHSTEVKLGVRGYLANVNYPGTGSGYIFGDAYFKTPVVYPVMYSDGKTPDVASSRLSNPYAELTQTGYINQWRSQLASNLQVTQKLDFWVKGLSVSGKFAFDTYNYTSMHRTKTPDTYLAIGRDSSGALIEQLTNPGKGTEYLDYSLAKQGSRTIYNELALNYRNTFGKHDVSGMLLFNQSDELNTQASDVITSLPYRFRGLAGRATYGYNDKYFLEFDFGYNGSENFAPDNRYGFFPSIGAGWVVSDESFFQSLKQTIQLFKFRFSYGLVGNSQITGRRFAYIATVESPGGYKFGENSDNSYSGKDIGEYASDVTWETARKTNLGVNIEALNGKLNLQADVFKEHRTGIFLRRTSLPYYLGLRNNPYGNVGIINNRGIDGTFTWNGNAGPVHFQFMGNFTWTRNKVIEDDLPAYKYPWMERKGRKVGQTFGYIALGLFESEKEIENSPLQNGDVRPGDIKFKDINGDGKIDSYDMTPIGYGSIPEIVYGVGFSFSYKAFALSGLFQGVGNVDILLSGEGFQPFQQGLSRGNLLENINDRWTTENPDPNAFYPRLSAGTLNDNYENSTWWLKNGKYLRLKSLQLSYNLPESFLKKVHLGKAYVFLEGINVLTFTPFKIYDVELGNGRGSAYPNTKTFAAGFGFNF